MTPNPLSNRVGESCFIYVRIYEKTNGVLTTYTGITSNMERRQKQHELGMTRTTNRFKNYKLINIKFTKLNNCVYEYTFKKYSIKKKINIIKTWTDFPSRTR